jgi:hypothetical protein
VPVAGRGEGVEFGQAYEARKTFPVPPPTRVPARAPTRGLGASDRARRRLPAAGSLTDVPASWQFDVAQRAATPFRRDLERRGVAAATAGLLDAMTLLSWWRSPIGAASEEERGLLAVLAAARPVPRSSAPAPGPRRDQRPAAVSEPPGDARENSGHATYGDGSVARYRETDPSAEGEAPDGTVRVEPAPASSGARNGASLPGIAPASLALARSSFDEASGPEDLTGLADQIGRILADEARRYGIDA